MKPPYASPSGPPPPRLAMLCLLVLSGGLLLAFGNPQPLGQPLPESAPNIAQHLGMALLGLACLSGLTWALHRRRAAGCACTGLLALIGLGTLLYLTWQWLV